MKLSENLLQSITEGKPVDITMIPGHISTPAMPEEIFDIEYNQDGTEFKRTINADKWISWLQDVGKANRRKKSDISSKAIAQSKFYHECHIASKFISKNIEKVGDDTYSGVIWSLSDKTYTIGLKNEQITEAIKALKKALDHSVTPISANPFDSHKSTLTHAIDEEAIMDILRGTM